MSFKYKFTSIFLILIAFLIGLVLYEERGESYETEFSYSLKKWFDQGKNFTYKQFNVFYVHDTLTNEKINFNKTQEKSNTTILFLHGFPTSSYDYYKIWNLLLSDHLNENDRLSQAYKSILAFDHLGYGFSDKPTDYKYCILDKADLVHKLLVSLGIKSIVLIAHDMSDSVALELIKRQELETYDDFVIEKCILMNGGIIISTLRPILSQHILRTRYLKFLYAKLIKWPAFKYIGDFNSIFGSLNKPNATELYDFYLTIKYNDGFNILPLTIEYMSQREILNDMWYEWLKKTSVPLMFIYGPADPINPNTLFPQKLSRDAKNVKLVILSDMIGHYPQFEDPFTVFQLIKSFLNN